MARHSSSVAPISQNADWLPAIESVSGDRATHDAACHGCLLIAETSCEMRNLFLDRNLLVPTMANDGAGLFDIAMR